jgi:hypothetical protein
VRRGSSWGNCPIDVDETVCDKNSEEESVVIEMEPAEEAVNEEDVKTPEKTMDQQSEVSTANMPDNFDSIFDGVDLTERWADYEEDEPVGSELDAAVRNNSCSEAVADIQNADQPCSSVEDQQSPGPIFKEQGNTATNVELRLPIAEEKEETFQKISEMFNYVEKAQWAHSLQYLNRQKRWEKQEKTPQLAKDEGLRNDKKSTRSFQ